MITDTIRLHAYESFTTAEGPGHRICIWVQGCSIRCHGCFNEETWDLDGGTEVTVDELYERMMKDITVYPTIEGVTFLGGEPFLQAAALANLANRLKKQDLSIVTFTGFPYRHLQKVKREDWEVLLAETDLLIDGPYIDSLHDLKRPWIGSLNQQYRFLTDRYKHLEDQLLEIENKIEVHLHPDGTVHINGIAQSLTLEELKKLFS